MKALPKRLLAYYGTASPELIDTTNRYVINAEHLSEFCSQQPHAAFARYLYTWLIIKKYGMPRAELRKQLGMDADAFEAFVSEGKALGVFRERTSYGGKELKANKVRVMRGVFPGIGGLENEGDYPAKAYKFNFMYFIRFYETWGENKKMLRAFTTAVKALPWMNHRYGFMCENPEEFTLGYIRPVSIVDAARLVGVARSTFYEDVSSMEVKDVEEAEKKLALGGVVKLPNGKSVFMVNGKLFYHDDYDPMLFMYTHGDWDEEFTIEDWDEAFRMADIAKRDRRAAEIASFTGTYITTALQAETAKTFLGNFIKKYFPFLEENTVEKRKLDCVERLLPYMNIRYNVLCYDARDIGLKRLVPLTLEEVRDAARYKGSTDEFIEAMSHIASADGEQIPILKKVKLACGGEGYSINPFVARTTRCAYKSGVNDWRTSDTVVDVEPIRPPLDKFDTDYYKEVCYGNMVCV